MHNYTTAPELTRNYVTSVWETLPRHVRPTTLLPCPCPALFERFGCEVTIASETFQYTGSFKFRAAYNLLSAISQQRVVAASSGNFGQAVAYASKLLGKTCTIVMPSTSAQVKIAAVQAYGGIVDLVDVRQISRAERVAQLLQEQPDAFHAPAYDDYRVVAGNSTLGRDILQAADFDIIVAPIGGGGLCSGLVLARDYLHKQTEILGAEPLPGNDAARSLRGGQLLHNEHEPATIADGARTLSLGTLNWEILRQGVADIIEIPDELTRKATQHCFRFVNLKVEPTGALSIGALFAQPERFSGKRVCCIVSGGNVDPAIYAEIITA
jgi:threonine dehydratase